jgi:hypothetical protein
MERLRKSTPGVDILSSPKISVLSGNAAEIQVGQDNESGEFRGVRLGFTAQAPGPDGALSAEVRLEMAEDLPE